MIKDISKVPVRPGETLEAAIIRCHHEAFIVKTIGAAAGGITLEEFRALQDCGLVPHSVQYGWRPQPDENDFLIAALAAAYQMRAPIEKHEEIRRWTWENWQVVLPEKSVQITVAPKDQTFAVMHQKLTRKEQAAFERVTFDTANFIRGLGNVITEDFANARLETWNGTQPLKVPDAIQRQNRINAIRSVLQTAVKERWGAQKTAYAMAKAANDYARNWRRVAETELQGLFNDAAVLEAVKVHGLSVRIARVPETSACKTCKALFLDDNGVPILFDPLVLADNGVNVGRPRSEWLPTIYPLHPRCRCGVQPVPPGWSVDRLGRLTKDEPSQ